MRCFGKQNIVRKRAVAIEVGFRISKRILRNFCLPLELTNKSKICLKVKRDVSMPSDTKNAKTSTTAIQSLEVLKASSARACCPAYNPSAACAAGNWRGRMTSTYNSGRRSAKTSFNALTFLSRAAAKSTSATWIPGTLRVIDVRG